MRNVDAELLFPDVDPTDASGVPTDAALGTLAEPNDAVLVEDTEPDCADTQTAHAKIARTHGVDRLNPRIAHRRGAFQTSQRRSCTSYSRWAAEWKIVAKG